MTVKRLRIKFFFFFYIRHTHLVGRGSFRTPVPVWPDDQRPLLTKWKLPVKRSRLKLEKTFHFNKVLVLTFPL